MNSQTCANSSDQSCGLTLTESHSLHPSLMNRSSDESTLAQASFVLSSFSRGDHFAEAALGVAGEKRPDVLSHPGSAGLARDPIRVFRSVELEDQDQVCLVDLRDASRERTCIDDEPHALPRCLHGCVCHRLT